MWKVENIDGQVQCWETIFLSESLWWNKFRLRLHIYDIHLTSGNRIKTITTTAYEPISPFFRYMKDVENISTCLKLWKLVFPLRCTIIYVEGFRRQSVQMV